jgi:hypothetical protein
VFTVATILNPWFLSLLEIHTASSKFDTKHFAETATDVGYSSQESLGEPPSQPLFVLSVSRPSSIGGGSSGMRGVPLNVDLNMIFVATERKLVPVTVRSSMTPQLLCKSNLFFIE